MRYLNWDVLLFPAGSKVPLQEYKTACYVVPDPEFLSRDPIAGASGPGHAFEHTSSPQVPIVACFLANLTDGSPFRVSLHSWERPHASQGLQVVTQHGKSICYEARVFIDGLCVAGILFLDQGPWPQVIEMSSPIEVDKEGNKDFLRWPQFHPDMLTQSYWSAGESKGRIKITITEGYLQAPGALPFIRTRNIISFSFQHAPQQILENSGIAWPNAGMWYQPSHPIYNVASPVKQEFSNDEADLHTHSPRRRADSMTGIGDKMARKLPPQASSYRSMQPPLMMPPSVMQDFHHDSQAAAWNSLTQMPDPFVEGGQGYTQAYTTARSQKSDQSMPDYSRSITPASSRNATDSFSNTVKPLNTLQNHDSIFNDLLPIFHPDDSSNGVAAPANTRISSAANTPPIPSRPSVAAEARAASYNLGRSRAVSITTKDGHLRTRETSDVSMQSRFSEEQATMKHAIDVKVQARPASEVKGRKEGRVSELDVPNPVSKKTSTTSIGHTSGKENTPTIASATMVLSDGKRKRASTTPRLHFSSGDDALLGSSPTINAAKKKSVKIRPDTPPPKLFEDLDDQIIERLPLEIVNNVL